MKTVKYIQDCQTLEDFQEISKRITNMCDAERVTRIAASEVGERTSYWMRNFCEANFKRFENTEMYQILMGRTIGDKREYHYVPNPF